MASDNPTLAAANESTGLEPLNAQPTSPQPPNEQPTKSENPISYPSLPSGCSPVVFPLDLGSRTKSAQSVSSLPNANAFEDLVRAEIRPEGPVRAEEVELEEWEKRAGGGYESVVSKIRECVEREEVRVFRVERGVGKGEFYVMGLDLDGERIVGVRVTDLG